MNDSLREFKATSRRPTEADKFTLTRESYFIPVHLELAAVAVDTPPLKDLLAFARPPPSRKLAFTSSEGGIKR